MILAVRSLPRVIPAFPRTRGDDPEAAAREAEARHFSPHPRG